MIKTQSFSLFLELNVDKNKIKNPIHFSLQLIKRFRCKINLNNLELKANQSGIKIFRSVKNRN